MRVSIGDKTITDVVRIEVKDLEFNPPATRTFCVTVESRCEQCRMVKKENIPAATGKRIEVILT